MCSAVWALHFDLDPSALIVLSVSGGLPLLLGCMSCAAKHPACQLESAAHQLNVTTLSSCQFWHCIDDSTIYQQPCMRRGRMQARTAPRLATPPSAKTAPRCQEQMQAQTSCWAPTAPRLPYQARQLKSSLNVLEDGCACAHGGLWKQCAPSKQSYPGKRHTLSRPVAVPDAVQSMIWAAVLRHASHGQHASALVKGGRAGARPLAAGPPASTFVHALPCST